MNKNGQSSSFIISFIFVYNVSLVYIARSRLFFLSIFNPINPFVLILLESGINSYKINEETPSPRFKGKHRS